MVRPRGPGSKAGEGPGRLSGRQARPATMEGMACPLSCYRVFAGNPFPARLCIRADGTWLHGAAWRALKEEVLFFVGSLTCLSIFLAWRLAAPWCAPFLAVCVTSLLQVLAAMGGVYHEVRLAVAVLSFLSLLPVCASLFTAGAPRRHYLRTAAPSLLFAGLLLLFAWHYAGARLVYWDEFFWGGFVKHLVGENGLWAWGSVLPRHDSVLLYPPMVTILQALLQPMGTFSEPAIAVGEAAVLLSATGVVIHLARERGLSFWPVCFCALLTFGLLRSLGTPVRFFSYLFGYAESLQAAFYLVPALALLFAKDTPLTRMILFVGLPVLILCKVTGCLLALCILGTAALTIFFAVPAKQKIRQLLHFVILPGGACFLAWGLWRWYLQIHVLQKMPHLADKMANTVDFAVVQTVIAEYIRAFFLTDLISVPYIGALPVVSGTAFLLLLSVSCIVKKNAKCQRSLQGSQYISLGILLCCFFCWILAHAYVTIMYMTPEEQGRAASYDRYIAVAIAPFLITALVAALESGMRCHSFLTMRMVKGGAYLLATGFAVFFFIRPVGLPAPIAEMEQAAGIMAQVSAPGSRYWLVVGQEMYQYGNACQFYLMPDRQEAPVGKGIAFNPHDTPETALLGGKLPADLRATARRQKVDYLLLWRVPADFVARYGKELGLYEGEGFPLLLRLDAWREGERELPEKIVLPAQSGR